MVERVFLGPRDDELLKRTHITRPFRQFELLRNNQPFDTVEARHKAAVYEWGYRRLWHKQWWLQGLVPGFKWQHEYRDFLRPSWWPPETDKETAKRGERDADRDASRPINQFLNQVMAEVQKIHRHVSDPKAVYILAHERVKLRWMEWDIWEESWGDAFPYTGWRHERGYRPMADNVPDYGEGRSSRYHKSEWYFRRGLKD